MKNMKKGYIYIMTNRSFKEELVKIGYATDVEARRKQLSSTALPYEYETFATYETNSKLTDKQLHHLIDDLNPELRVRKEREFYKMSPEKAYEMILSIASISGTLDKVKDKDNIPDCSEPDNPFVKNNDPMFIAQQCVAMKAYLREKKYKGDIASEIARKYGVSRKQIFFYFNLLKLDKRIQQLIHSGEIGSSSIQPVLSIKPSERMGLCEILLQARNEGIQLTREYIKKICDQYKAGKRTWAELRSE